MERTLSIIKPDAVAKGVIGKILDRFESNGLRVAATKKYNSQELMRKLFMLFMQKDLFSMI